MHLGRGRHRILQFYPVHTIPSLVQRQLQRNSLQQGSSRPMGEVLCLNAGHPAWWHLVGYAWWALPLPLDLAMGKWETFQKQRGNVLLRLSSGMELEATVVVGLLEVANALRSVLVRPMGKVPIYKHERLVVVAWRIPKNARRATPRVVSKLALVGTFLWYP